MGFPRQEYWSELPFPPLRNFPNPGMELVSPALAENSLPVSYQGRARPQIMPIITCSRLTDV